MKTCNACGQAKEFACFSKRAASPDGLNYTCRDCSAQRARRWRDRHPGAFAQWREKNAEHVSARFAAWYARNKESRSTSYAEWAKRNRHVVNARTAKRRAAQRGATPPWADLAAMREIYRRADALTRETGVRHEVDHFFPLQGELVCGLHCEANLRILTKAENVRKRNKMPEVA